MSFTEYEERFEKDLEKNRRRASKRNYNVSPIESEVDPTCEFCGEEFCGTDEDHLSECPEAPEVE